jgi:SAM-dependent methyltransferase
MRELIKALLPERLRHSLRRKLPYAVNSLRRKLTYAFKVAIGRLSPLHPPPWLQNIGTGDFDRIGSTFVNRFRKLGGLKPTDAVLDIGCGSGRMAKPLTAFLTTGTYHGTDIDRETIAWCQRAYRRFPNFRFHYLNIFNGAYNPNGEIQASEYKFTFPAQSFDFIFLTSVFTHTLPKDTDNYISEIARMLKTGGRCFATFFLLNDGSLRLITEGKSTRPLKYPVGECLVENPDVPEAGIGYPEAAVLSLFAKNGFRIAGVYYGTWPHREGPDYQDIVIAVRE